MEKKEELFEVIREALVTFDVEALKKMVLQAVQRGVKAERIVDVMSEGMELRLRADHSWRDNEGSP